MASTNHKEAREIPGRESCDTPRSPLVLDLNRIRCEVGNTRRDGQYSYQEVVSVHGERNRPPGKHGLKDGPRHRKAIGPEKNQPEKEQKERASALCKPRQAIPVTSEQPMQTK